VLFAEGLRGNPAYRGIRAIYRRLRNRKPSGDVDLEYEDILTFADGFRDAHIERFSLCLGARELIAKPMGNGPGVRATLLALKLADDVVLRFFPGLRRYCSDVVGVLVK
jgi:hypothetical protein